jgi:hypothetical protein
MTSSTILSATEVANLTFVPPSGGAHVDPLLDGDIGSGTGITEQNTPAAPTARDSMSV